MKTFLLFIVCLTGMLAGVPAWCVDTNGTSALILRQAAEVDGTGVFLSQLVEDGSPPALKLLVAAAPAWGQALLLSRSQINEAVRKQDPGLALTNWSGAEQIKISRRARRLEEGELKDLLTATLQREQIRDRGELELRLIRPWNPITVPDESLVVRILDLPVSGISPNFILRFELLSEREKVGIYQIPLQARLWKDVLVARSTQPRGRLVRDADLGTERRDVLLLRDALVALDLADSSVELAESLPAGAPLHLGSVRARPVILRGRVLDAVIQDQSLMVTVKVEALEDGVPGQFIRVRNAKSKREFRAKVTNEQMVVVGL